MKSSLTGALALALAIPLAPAAGAQAPAAEPFPVVTIETPGPRSHLWAYVSMGAGAALVGASFHFTGRANELYADYLAATDPRRIERLYDDTLRHDTYARLALLGGEALIATGLYLRFIRRPRPPAKITWHVGASRCAVALHF